MIEFSKIFLLLTKFFLWKYWKSTIFFKSAILFRFVLQFLKRKCSHMKYYKMKLKMSKDKAYVELNWKKRKGLYSWGTPGRHEPPRFPRLTEPPLLRQSIRYADSVSIMQYTSLHQTVQICKNLVFFVYW